MRLAEYVLGFLYVVALAYVITIVLLLLKLVFGFLPIDIDFTLVRNWSVIGLAVMLALISLAVFLHYIPTIIQEEEAE